MKFSVQAVVDATMEEMGWPRNGHEYDGVRRTVKAGILAYKKLSEIPEVDDGIAGCVDDIVGQFI